MGRGRAKAKQTRVARELKYRPVETDFSSLERELRGNNFVDDIDDNAEDSYAELASEYESHDEDGYDDYERRSS